MSIRINGQTGIDVGDLPITNAGNAEVEGTLVVQGQNVSPFSGFKNYIINGNFDVWQRGTSQTTTGYGSDDRWYNSNIGSTKTHSQVVCTDTERALFKASKFSRTVATYVSGTNSLVAKEQTIEDITRLAGKTVTLSFWAKADSNKQVLLDTTSAYGTGGSPSTSGDYTYPKIFNFTNTWQKFTHTFTIPSIIGKTLGTDGAHTTGLRIGFTFSASADRREVVNGGFIVGQSGTFDIAQVQLEEGSVATPFEQRPYGLELALCQRYLPKFTHFVGVGTVRSVTTASIICNFIVPPRVPPTGILASGYGVIENGGTWTEMVIAISSSSLTSANTLWSNGAATMTLGQASEGNIGANGYILFTGCEL